MGTIQKIRTDVNVLHAAIHRIEWLFETFSSVCLSFLEEKTLLCCSILRPMWFRRKKRRFSVLFIDWEAQYQCTIAHILKMREMYRDVTETFTGWHSPDYGKRCLSVSAGMDMLGTVCGVGSSATR